jgi:hypothetical protein
MHRQQRLRLAGVAAGSEVSRRGEQRHAHAQQQARGEQAVLEQRASPYGEVDVLGHQVDPPRRQVEFELHPRVVLDEPRQHRGQHHGGKVRWHRHPQAAAGLRLPVLGQRLRGFHFAGQRPGMGEHALPEFRDGQPAGAALQQSLAQALLERRDAPRNGGLGQAQPQRRRAEAAGVGHPGIQQQVVGIEFHRQGATGALGG